MERSIGDVGNPDLVVDPFSSPAASTSVGDKLLPATVLTPEISPSGIAWKRISDLHQDPYSPRAIPWPKDVEPNNEPEPLNFGPLILAGTADAPEMSYAASSPLVRTPDAKRRKSRVHHECLENERNSRQPSTPKPHPGHQQSQNQLTLLVDLLEAYPTLVPTLQHDRTTRGDARSLMASDTRDILDQALDRVTGQSKLDSPSNGTDIFTSFDHHARLQTEVQLLLPEEREALSLDIAIGRAQFGSSSGGSAAGQQNRISHPKLPPGLLRKYAPSPDSPTINSSSASTKTQAQSLARHPSLLETTCVLCGTAEVPDPVVSNECVGQVTSDSVSSTIYTDLAGSEGDASQPCGTTFSDVVHTSGRPSAGEKKGGRGKNDGFEENGEQSPDNEKGKDPDSGSDKMTDARNWYKRIDLACPEFVADPDEHRSCSTVVLRGISAVTQHLKRNHDTRICTKCCQTMNDHTERCQGEGQNGLEKWQLIFEKLRPGRGIPLSPYLRDHLDLMSVIYTTDLFKFLRPELTSKIGIHILEHSDEIIPLVTRAEPTTIRALKLALFGDLGCFTEYYETTKETSHRDFLDWMRQPQVTFISAPDSAYGSSPDQLAGNQFIQGT